jgi:hypothetical protein
LGDPKTLDASLRDSNTIHWPTARIGDAAPWTDSVCQFAMQIPVNSKVQMV